MFAPYRRRSAVALLLILFVAPLYLRAEEPKTSAPAPTTPAVRQAAMADGFLRFVDNGVAGGRLETSDVTYRNADGVSVRLVSAVHIGEKTYYEGLGRSFAEGRGRPRPRRAPAGGQPHRGRAAVPEGRAQP